MHLGERGAATVPIRERQARLPRGGERLEQRFSSHASAGSGQRGAPALREAMAESTSNQILDESRLLGLLRDHGRQVDGEQKPLVSGQLRDVVSRLGQRRGMPNTRSGPRVVEGDDCAGLEGWSRHGTGEMGP